MIDTAPRKNNQRSRLNSGVILMIFGLFLSILGIDPAIFGMDRSSVTGFVQITVFLIGLAVVCIGGYVALNVLWNGRQKTILADIGIRLVATGYVISVAAGLADVFGFGSHPFPNIPSFGGIQVIGVMLGQATIAIGFLMFIPDPRKTKDSFQNS